MDGLLFVASGSKVLDGKNTDLGYGIGINICVATLILRPRPLQLAAFRLTL